MFLGGRNHDGLQRGAHAGEAVKPGRNEDYLEAHRAIDRATLGA